MTLFGGTDEQDTEMAKALADALVDFQHNVLFSSLVNTVPIFKGERDKYKLWAQSIDSVLSLMSNNDLYAIRAAAQTSQGYVARSIQEYWTEKKENSKWADLKKLLEAQFDFSLDQSDALIQLRNAKQKPGHTYQMFAEDLELLANQAYSTEDVSSDIVKRELVTIFTMGVNHSKVRAHLVRHPPDDLKKAIKAARDEEQLLERVNMYNKTATTSQGTKYITQPRLTSRYEEPIECDEIKFQYTNNGDPICNRCGIAGHIRRNCRVRIQVNPNTGNKVYSQGTNNSQHNSQPNRPFQQPPRQSSQTPQTQQQRQTPRTQQQQRTNPQPQQQPRAFNRSQGNGGNGRFNQRNRAQQGNRQGNYSQGNQNRYGNQSSQPRQVGASNSATTSNQRHDLLLERVDGTQETLPRGTKIVLLAEGESGVSTQPLN